MAPPVAHLPPGQRQSLQEETLNEYPVHVHKYRPKVLFVPSNVFLFIFLVRDTPLIIYKIKIGLPCKILF